MNTWRFLAGLGLFLYGLSLMGQMTGRMTGRAFRLFLRRHTKSLIKSIFGGAFITGLIQSSSVIILMLISFVSAGIIPFRNALGLLIGSNLGTTLDSWFVASVGFTFDLQTFSLPLIAVTAILMFFTEKRERLYDSLYLVFSIGILLLGFGFMKEGAARLIIQFDIAAYGNSNLFFILLVGFVLTIVIQSSLATVAIALTALHAHALTLPAAAALIIGSEVGTTIKILFASMNSSPGGRMLAWGDFFFNVFTAIIAYIFLFPILYFIQHIVHIDSPMIALVFFQSFINLLAIILVIPLMKPFADLLERFFSMSKPRAQNDFDIEASVVPELMPGTMREAATGMLKRVLAFHSRIFIPGPPGDKPGMFSSIRSFTRVYGTTNREYARIKQAEGDCLKFYGTISEEDIDKANYKKINNYLDSIRQSIHAAKSVHDIRDDVKMFRDTSNNYLFSQDEIIRADWKSFHDALLDLDKASDESELKQMLIQLKQISLSQYQLRERESKAALFKGEIQRLDASTLLNVYQELFSSKKALLRAEAFLRLDLNDGAEGEFSI